MSMQQTSFTLKPGRSWSWGIGLVMLFITACGGSAPSTSDAATASDPQEVLDREAERAALLEARDYDALEAMMTASSTYTHSNGIMDTREEFLATLRSGDVIYRSINHHDASVRFIAPTVAVINASSDLVVNVQGEDRDVFLRMTILYVLEDGEWNFEAWHSSPRQP